MAGQAEEGGRVLSINGDFPGADCFFSICGAKEIEIGKGTEEGAETRPSQNVVM